MWSWVILQEKKSMIQTHLITKIVSIFLTTSTVNNNWALNYRPSTDLRALTERGCLTLITALYGIIIIPILQMTPTAYIRWHRVEIQALRARIQSPCSQTLNWLTALHKKCIYMMKSIYFSYCYLSADCWLLRIKIFKMV